MCLGSLESHDSHGSLVSLGRLISLQSLMSLECVVIIREKKLLTESQN